MIKNICQLEHVVENKSIRLQCDNDTPIPYLKEALFQFLKYAGMVEDANLAAQKEAEKVAEPEQPIAPEVQEIA